MYDTLYLRDHTLGDVLSHLLKPSQNRLAEELFKTLALEKTGSLARDSSIAVVSRQLASWNVPNDGYILYDGSGYNRADYLSPSTIAQVLLALRSDSAFSVFYNALPIAGVDGTLVHRMRASDTQGNVHAKTGSLHAIRSLSGYLTTDGGDELTFSFLCNAFTVDPHVVTGIMDHAVVLLAGLPKLP
jgi:D-alanyl-D-alanine carboxypeptidase/D-alanyl-D-alanine-endopeptidase (penicillin-binding protein 4)